MKIKCLQVGPIGTNCYLLCDEDAKTCAVIDPGGDGARIAAAVAETGCVPLSLIHILPVHPGPEGVDVLLGDGKARRQLVAAEALQQVGAGLQRGKQVEPAVGPAGTLAHAVF